jgi:phospholipid/cholesterol/gamma-HCH transport system substrate-binding protein
VLNAFQPDVRTGLYNLIDQLGNGLADRGADLKRAFVLLAPFLRIAGNVAGQLATRATLTKELVHNAAYMSTVLASRSTQLHNLVVNGNATLQALSTQGGAPLRTTIENLPEMLHTTVTVFHAADRLFPNTEQLISALHPVANDLPQGLTNLENLASSANPAIVKLETPVRKLLPLATALQPFSSHLSNALTLIKPQLTDVNTATTAVAACTLEINEFWNWDQSMSKWTDELGPMVRGNANFGFYTAPGVTNDQQYGYRPQCYNGGPPPLGRQATPKFIGPPPTP